MKRLALRSGLAWGVAVVASLLVFAMYTSPDMIVALAMQVRSCF